MSDDTVPALAVPQGKAPKDREVELWIVHEHAKFCLDPVSQGYAASVRAHWIDFNGGGWTWDGLCGLPMH